MKLPKGLTNDTVLHTWMAQGRSGNSNVQSASFSSSMWKHAAAVQPQVVAIGLTSFRTTNLSLDSFMASHSPRTNCASKQKFMLKPLHLDQTSCLHDVHSTFSKDMPGLRISQDCVLPDRPHSNYNRSQESKTSPSVVTIGNYGGSSKQYAPDTLYTFRNNSFHTSPRLSQATRQKIMLGNSFRFNYQSGYLNVIQQPTGLVARGTPVTAMSQKQSHTKPVIRLQSKGVGSEKADEYPDVVVGASPSFQARMTEIAQHELDTVKWEKVKKGRKKCSSSS